MKTSVLYSLSCLRNFFTSSSVMADSDDLEAILTHWLQTPEIRPPLMPKDAYTWLCGLLEALQNVNAESWGRYATQLDLPLHIPDVPYPPPSQPDFTFIDLFAGIGGFRIAMQEANGKCLFTCEWDKFAKQTYAANFGEVPYGDIHKFTAPSVSDDELNRLIPGHDVLCAGFPCQPFSLAGVSKNQSLGRKHGFEHATQGTLFFDIARILKVKRPPAFFLENVKNLMGHNHGQTFKIIKRTLENELGYVINWAVVDGRHWCPQHRERVFIVGYNPNTLPVSKSDIRIPTQPSSSNNKKTLAEVIEREVDSSCTLGPGTWQTLVRHKKHHQSKGQGFGYGIHTAPFADDEVTRTISARYHKDGAEILIDQPSGRPRRLTVREAMQLQGYDPDSFVFPVSNTQAYRQIGNSVVVPAICDTAAEIARMLRKLK